MRSAADQQCRTRAGAGRYKSASRDKNGESIGPSRIHTGGMQRNDVCSRGNCHTGCAGLRGIVLADGYNLQRVGSWRNRWRRVRAGWDDRAAQSARASRSLNLPDDALIGRSQNAGREPLHTQRWQSHVVWLHAYQDVIDDSDL